jgi:hypothetical protein
LGFPILHSNQSISQQYIQFTYFFHLLNRFCQDERLGGGSNGWIKQLRVLRAFRLFRLFSKMGQLKRIVTAVALSIVPTLQALVSRD